MSQMAASTQSSPAIGQLKQIAYTTRAGNEKTLPVEQIPGGYQLPFAALFNQWQLYGHMRGRIYPTVDALLDDAAQGWMTWREHTHTTQPVLTNRQETDLIRVALHQAGIRPQSVRHYLGPVIIVMGRPEEYVGEFRRINGLAWDALDSAPGARNLCVGIHVFSRFRGKRVAGYDHFRRYRR